MLTPSAIRLDVAHSVATSRDFSVDTTSRRYKLFSDAVNITYLVSF